MIKDNEVQFKRLLDTLARSSAQAVTTLGYGFKDVDELKEYLYVETEIEKVFKKTLDSASDSIIFLCGSSGDGKSELLKRYYSAYSDNFHFHFDATHSFQPDQTAIDALDQLFDEYGTTEKPLVVGINVGMLFNYSSSGNDQHHRIKEAIELYLNEGTADSPFTFLNFENQPKFSIENDKVSSAFVSELISRIVSDSDKNPLYKAYLEAIEVSSTRQTTNYRLLQYESVRTRIVELLFYTRLKFDQFLPTRALLDFIHHLIDGPGWLFDNIFVVGHNELSDIISNFDPCAIRSKKIDQFFIQYPLGVSEPIFIEFEKNVSNILDIRVQDAAGWLRFFYLFQNVEIGNNFHKNFHNDFQQPLYNRYIEVWRLHMNYDGSQESRKLLRNFYQDEFISALMRFGNRLNPSLTRENHLFLYSRNGVSVSAEADIKVDLIGIKDQEYKNIHEFSICLKVCDQSLRRFQVNVSFLELIYKINNGYRPNKHDKNTIIVLEEIIDEVTKAILKSDKLLLSDKNFQVTLTNEFENDEIVVGDIK